MARRGQFGIISRLVAAPREESCTAKGRTHKAMAGQSQGREKLAVISAAVSPPCLVQASPLMGLYGSTATTSISMQLQQGGKPSGERHHHALQERSPHTILRSNPLVHILPVPECHLVQYIKVC